MATLASRNIPGDIVRDGTVDFKDVVILAANYGKTSATYGMGDLNGDGKVDFQDLVILASHYGQAIALPVAALLEYAIPNTAMPIVNTGTLAAFYDGQLNGGGVTLVPSGAGYGAEFNGDGSYISPLNDSNSDDFNIADSDFTIQATIQSSTAGSASGLEDLVWKTFYGLDPGYAFGIESNTGRVRLLLQDGTSSIYAESTVPVLDGKVHHVVGIRRDNMLYVYVDGVASPGVALTNLGSTVNNGVLAIGARPGDLASAFTGIIDDVAIYDTALNPM